MKQLFWESIPVMSTFLPKLRIVTLFCLKKKKKAKKKPPPRKKRQLGKSLLWHREASLLQHCDSNLRLISQEGIEKLLYKLILCLRVLKGFLFSFISACKSLVLILKNFKTHLFEVTVKILSYFVLTELTFTLFKVFSIKANTINSWCEVGQIHLPEKMLIQYFVNI